MNSDIEIPDKLDAVIRNAIDRAQHKRRPRLVSALAASAAAVFILAGLYTYPAVAAFVKSPDFADSIPADIYQRLVQSVKLKQSNNGLTFTVQEIVSDSRLLYIPFTIKTKPGLEHKLQFRLSDGGGNILLDPDTAGPDYGTFSTTYAIDEDMPGIYNGYLRLRAAEWFSYSGEIKLDVWVKGETARIWTYAIANTPGESKVLVHDSDLSFNLQTEERLYPLHAGTVALYPMETVLSLTEQGTDLAPFLERMYLEDGDGNRAAYKGGYTERDAEG
ncbi:MAG: hypothetical protein K0Q90_1593, partial [Paenibacillaceae bacterium]|nr:hypothetical protein [Paenibacillaceae bacterium]